MKQYKFSLKDECMKELPSMEEPKKLYGRESWQPPVIGSYICSYCGYHSSTAIHDMKHYCIYDKYEEHLASLQSIPVLKKYLSSFTDGKIYNEYEFEIVFICPLCGGDGKETCSNPDHGFINALSFHDIGRLGCPVCGHDENHKVKNGGDCDVCGGSGNINCNQLDSFLKEYNYDDSPNQIAIPKQKVDDAELWKDIFIYIEEHRFLTYGEISKHFQKHYTITKK